MSILDEAIARLGEGRIMRADPLLAGVHARVVYVETELYEEIQRASIATSGDIQFRIGQLRRDLDRFSSGALITVGYGTEKSCFMKPLEPTTEEVWEIRSRDPQPSIRLFGRFLDTDVFFITNMAWRSALGGWGSFAWAQEIRNCKAKWRGLFPVYPPHSGQNINDYIRDNVLEVGHLP